MSSCHYHPIKIFILFSLKLGLVASSVLYNILQASLHSILPALEYFLKSIYVLLWHIGKDVFNYEPVFRKEFLLLLLWHLLPKWIEDYESPQLKPTLNWFALRISFFLYLQSAKWVLIEPYEIFQNYLFWVVGRKLLLEGAGQIFACYFFVLRKAAIEVL